MCTFTQLAELAAENAFDVLQTLLQFFDLLLEAEFASQFAVRNELRKRIFRRFREEGIAIPFPTRTVRLEAPAKPESSDRPKI